MAGTHEVAGVKVKFTSCLEEEILHEYMYFGANLNHGWVSAPKDQTEKVNVVKLS